MKPFNFEAIDAQTVATKARIHPLSSYDEAGTPCPPDKKVVRLHPGDKITLMRGTETESQVAATIRRSDDYLHAVCDYARSELARIKVLEPGEELPEPKNIIAKYMQRAMQILSFRG